MPAIRTIIVPENSDPFAERLPRFAAEVHGGFAESAEHRVATRARLNRLRDAL